MAAMFFQPGDITIFLVFAVLTFLVNAKELSCIFLKKIWFSRFGKISNYMHVGESTVTGDGIK